MKKFALELLASERICLMFIVEGAMPTTTDGKKMFQEQSRGTASASALGVPGKRIFGGEEHPGHKKVKLDLSLLTMLGWKPNNVGSLSDKYRSDRFWVRVWFSKDEDLRAMRLEDWGEAGKYIEQALGAGFNMGTVYDNQGVLSINLMGRLSKAEPEWLISPVLVEKKEAPTQPVEKKKIVLSPRLVCTGPEVSAMSSAFAKAGVVK